MLWTSAPKIVDVHTKKCVFPAGPVTGRNFLTLGHPGVRVRNIRRRFAPNHLCLLCCFFPKKLKTNFFFSNFLGASGISRQNSQDIPPKVCFPQFEGTYRTLWTPPLDMEDPHATERYPDQSFNLCSFFRELRNIYHHHHPESRK